MSFLARHWALVLASTWTLIMLTAFSVPGRDLPQVDVFSADKIVHFCLFVGFGILWMHALSPHLRRTAFWVLGTGLVFAVGTEFYQQMLPLNRTFDPGDILANAGGLTFATYVYHTWRTRRAKT